MDSRDSAPPLLDMQRLCAPIRGTPDAQWSCYQPLQFNIINNNLLIGTVNAKKLFHYYFFLKSCLIQFDLDKDDVFVCYIFIFSFLSLKKKNQSIFFHSLSSCINASLFWLPCYLQGKRVCHTPETLFHIPRETNSGTLQYGCLQIEDLYFCSIFLKKTQAQDEDQYRSQSRSALNLSWSEPSTAFGMWMVSEL